MVKKKKSLYTVGVTGGIGSGKSVVVEMFSRLGIPVLFADDLSKEISEADAAVRKKLVSALGPEAYSYEGNLDRAFVASKIFSSPPMRKKIEAILHPAVQKEIARRTARLQEAGHTMAIVEAALVYESGMDRYLDAVVVVDAAESVRIRRVQERDHIHENEIRARMHAQIDPQKKAAKGDYVLHNNGSLGELEEKVKLLFSVFQKLTSEE
ncbi:MAG: dephospho-CoA kinase [Bacteroidota bacterium]